MARTGIPDYRKLAFELYAPLCVYCGFGIKAVLEVAHLDCNSQNCSPENLAILCPTCHRMHDIDLIPTDVIRRMRDEKRLPNWKKLMKDAAAKAVVTKRTDPDHFRRAGVKAAATRRARQKWPRTKPL